MQRARVSQELRTTAADYTVEVSGLDKLPSTTTKADVARLFCQTVVDSWRWRRKQRSPGTRWWLTSWRRPAENKAAAAAARRGRGRGRRARGRAQQDGPQWVEFGARSFQREALSKREETQCALPGEEIGEIGAEIAEMSELKEVRDIMGDVGRYRRDRRGDRRDQRAQGG